MAVSGLYFAVIKAGDLRWLINRRRTKFRVFLLFLSTVSNLKTKNNELFNGKMNLKSTISERIEAYTYELQPIYVFLDSPLNQAFSEKGFI